MTRQQVILQREEVGLKILDQIIDEEILDLNQLAEAIKKIESFCKQRSKQERAMKSTQLQIDKLMQPLIKQKSQNFDSKGKSVIKRMFTANQTKKAATDKVNSQLSVKGGLLVEDPVELSKEDYAHQIDPEELSALETDLEFHKQQFNAYSVICQILITNLMGPIIPKDKTDLQFNVNYDVKLFLAERKRRYREIVKHIRDIFIQNC